MSAAKFARAERDLKAARPLGAAAQSFYKHVEVGCLQGGPSAGSAPPRPSTNMSNPQECSIGLEKIKIVRVYPDTLKRT